MSALRTFLDRVYGGCDGLVEFRSLPSGRRAWVRPGSWPEVAPFLTAEVAAQQNVFVGAATRQDDTSGAAHNLAETNVVFIDFDGDSADLDTQLARFPFPPSLVIGSGYGRHLYWALREPLALRQGHTRARFAAVLKGLAGALQGDTSAATPERILRPPTLLSFKYAPPRRVELLAARNLVVDVSELEAVVSVAHVVPTKRPVKQRVPKGERNDTLYRFCRSARFGGCSLLELYRAARAFNAERCAPPLRADEVDKTIRHAWEQPDAPGFLLTPAVVHDAPSASPSPVQVPIQAPKSAKAVGEHEEEHL